MVTHSYSPHFMGQETSSERLSNLFKGQPVRERQSLNVDLGSTAPESIVSASTCTDFYVKRVGEMLANGSPQTMIGTIAMYLVPGKLHTMKTEQPSVSSANTYSCRS